MKSMPEKPVKLAGNLIFILSCREPVPLSEATFVVGEGGRVSGSVRGEGNEILDGNFFGPYQSVNLGQSFNPATANLPVGYFLTSLFFKRNKKKPIVIV